MVAKSPVALWMDAFVKFCLVSLKTGENKVSSDLKHVFSAGSVNDCGSVEHTWRSMEQSRLDCCFSDLKIFWTISLTLTPPFTDFSAL